MAYITNACLTFKRYKFKIPDISPTAKPGIDK